MFQELAFSRGHKVKCHIQRNIGGNTDFLNMTDTKRLKSKKISKENIIRAQDKINNANTGSFFYMQVLLNIFHIIKIIKLLIFIWN